MMEELGVKIRIMTIQSRRVLVAREFCFNILLHFLKIVFLELFIQNYFGQVFGAFRKFLVHFIHGAMNRQRDHTE